MKELLDTLATWQAGGTRPTTSGRAVVVRTFGSAPRPRAPCSCTHATVGSRARSAAAA
jgi:hypothetical protein